MVTSVTASFKGCLVFAVGVIFTLTICVQQGLLKFPTVGRFCQSNSIPPSSSEDLQDDLGINSQVLLLNRLKDLTEAANIPQRKTQPDETEQQVRRILSEIDQLIPKVRFTHLDNTTCAGQSKVSIVNPRERYCIGDQVTVQLDMYDYLGNRKKYGGDMLRARIYSPDLLAGASGKITDFQNGTYQVHFTLFWAGIVKISLFLIHPSEAVATLWRARNTGYNYVDHKVKYTNATHKVEARCAYDLDTEEEVCNIMEKKDEYPFYCIKPAHMPCASITQMTSYFTHKSYFTDLERPLFDRSRIRAAITHGLQDLNVNKCSNESSPVKEKCKTGMKHEAPAGYFLQDVWHPVSCSMKQFTSQDEINGCLKGKSLHLIGDSTMVQWMDFITGKVNTLKDLDLHGEGWQKSRLKVDTDRNIQIKFQKHGNPFIFLDFYSVVENPTLPEMIARVGGNKESVIAFTVGAHFRLFPLHIFIRRAINIRRALQELLLRSPETRVVLKTENTSSEPVNFEEMSDFHGYIQYQIMNSLLKGLDIGRVDAWDMTTAFATNSMHPPPNVIENEMDLFLTFLC
ncbi:NXPE family member 4-like isoform X2 [Pleurodeles waltl]